MIRRYVYPYFKVPGRSHLLPNNLIIFLIHVLYSLLFPAFILLIWFLGGQLHWYSELTLPTPARFFVTLKDLMASGEIVSNLGISMQRVVEGFLLGATLGLILGAGMGLSTLFYELTYPLFRLLSFVPIIGWLPLAILCLGIDEAIKIVLIAKAALVPVTINTSQGLRNVPIKFKEVANALKFSPIQLLSKVVIPAAFPAIWGGMRYGLSHCWMALVLVELLASTEGIGYMMLNGQQLMQTDVLLVSVFVIGFVGSIIDALLELMESHILRWRK